MAPPRNTLLARAPIIDKINHRLQRAWDRGWLEPIEIEPDWLWHRASRNGVCSFEAGGRCQQDVADFRQRLDQLCWSINNQAKLNPIGRCFAYGQITRAIRQRLELGKLWHDKPQILDISLASPIIVLGQMRAGTTRVHRLLAADPDHAATRFCDSWNPVPAKPDLRPAWSGIALFWARRLNPWIDTIHPFSAARPDEELGWLAGAFNHAAYEAQWRITDYVAYSEARTPEAIYREFARILRTDASNRGNAGKPRVIKVPQFSEDLPTLLEQFPEARIVVAERNHQDTVDSAISLVANQMAMQSDHVDIDWLRKEWDRKTQLRRERVEHALRGFRGRVASVDFGSLDTDWEGAVRRIYAALGLTLGKEALAAMRAEQKQASRLDHRAHRTQIDSIKDRAAAENYRAD